MGNKITRRRPVIDERYTRPQGLYPCRDVDQRKLRRLILESKLAPCYSGAEEPDKDLEECPICFLQYPSLNRSKCCTKGICTECFLQMKAPHAARPTQCPFCKTPCYAVEYRGAKTLEEKGMEQAEEQKVIEAKIRMRQQELQDDVEREQRREEDIRAGRVRVPTPQPQALAASALDERNTSGMDPYALWVDGDYQRTGGLDITAPLQQSAESMSTNTMPPANNQQAEIAFSTPRAQHREDDFDLDIEDIMVMEAIWLSIQEQGARHRCANPEPTQPAPNQRGEEPLTEITEPDDNTHPEGDTTTPDTSQPPLPRVPDLEVDRRPGELSTTEVLETTGIEPERCPRVGEPETAIGAPAPETASGESSGDSGGGSGGGGGGGTNNEKVVFPESFEEQMVWAMALSIAETQTRVDSRSGSLLQPAHMGH